MKSLVIFNDILSKGDDLSICVLSIQDKQKASDFFLKILQAMPNEICANDMFKVSLRTWQFEEFGISIGIDVNIDKDNCSDDDLRLSFVFEDKIKDHFNLVRGNTLDVEFIILNSKIEILVPMFEIDNWEDIPYIHFSIGKKDILRFLDEIKQEMKAEISQDDAIVTHP